MKNLVLTVLLLVLAGAAVYIFVGIGKSVPEVEKEQVSEVTETLAVNKPKGALSAFASQKELDDFLRELAEKQKLRRETQQSKTATANTSASPSTNEPTAALSDGESKSDKDESVTNVQHAGVDEGGIVKVHKDHLVILRRGRLFTVAVNDNALRPVSMVDAFAPDVDPSGTWYDEMLISKNTIAVIGYSYQRGGTEIGLFGIDDEGNLNYRSTYHLRSNDYYSSRNYASRLVEGKLVFYTPHYFWPGAQNVSENFPAVRKWRRGVTPKDFQPITAPTRIYRAPSDLNETYGIALHTVTVCDLESAEFSCQATGVIGPSGRVFYVSPQAVYVWATDSQYGRERTENRSTLFQMPLNGSAPSALSVSGSPIDQFSFLEDREGYLNVLVRSEANGDGMWKAETASGDVALMRVAIKSFSDGREFVPASSYRELPKPQGYTFQNRFVGDRLLYGTGNGWDLPEKERAKLYAVRYATGNVEEISLDHSVDRIEPLGKDVVVIGTDGKNLYFSPVALDSKLRLHEPFVRKNAAQGELRSHGFFYKSESADAGLLGLPIRDGGSGGYENLYKDSASVLFLRNDSLKFSELGELESRPVKQSDDRCRASCVDWYGNARPLFIRGRIFGLLGYELVEGELKNSSLTEKRRVNYLKSQG